ncbi:hypothetical protein [Streptacidiphilus anmyonensis]|uniref:hypothetical protein n=1 Tax=Streptacidiphilus anmyonensis TaxID=405782 RepID=UPI0005A7CC46|nr:hypothetical protein [Streptacidiphilus anmyonensis]
MTIFRDAKAQSRQIGAKWHGGSLDRITAPATLHVMPGVGHFLSCETWAVCAEQVRALADRAATAEPARG